MHTQKRTRRENSGGSVKNPEQNTAGAATPALPKKPHKYVSPEIHPMGVFQMHVERVNAKFRQELNRANDEDSQVSLRELWQMFQELLPKAWIMAKHIQKKERTKPPADDNKPETRSGKRIGKFNETAVEWGLVALREFPGKKPLCDSPEGGADYWRRHIPSHPYFNAECECLVVIVVDTRRNVRGHYVVSVGTMDTLLVHAREVFRQAVIGGASAIVLAHNHPSGDPRPSAADIKVTRDLIRAGNLLKVEVLDHIIMGSKREEASQNLA